MRNLGPVSVAQLEVAAVESLAAFFRDPKKPKNDRKRPILKELFRVAKMEERYKRNEIGKPQSPKQCEHGSPELIKTPCFRWHDPNHDRCGRHDSDERLVRL